MSILYNPEFHRWEVYREHPFKRGGAVQPDFVSASYEKCEEYARKVEEAK